MDILQAVDAEHPGLLRYVQIFALYVSLPMETLCARMTPALQRLGERRLGEACAALEAAGVLPEIVVETDAQVQAVWENPLLQTCLRYGVRFYPPLDFDIRASQSAPLSSMLAVTTERPCLLDPTAWYWQQQLAATFPEICLMPWLEPLRTRYGSQLRGADLACGWGRVCLSLRDYEGLTVYACDLSRLSLRVLARLARNAGLQDHIVPTRADVTTLPFEDASIHFFTVFDILEHLTYPTFEQVLREILRCAVPGAVVYAEIPLQSKCPVITHLHDFYFTPLVARIQRLRHAERRFKLRHAHPMMMHHMTFTIEPADVASA